VLTPTYCHIRAQGWIPRLERKLEVAAESAHPDFRCFFSAEPINGAPHAKIVPESILQTCVKISNEPPSDMKSNMRRAFAAFSQARAPVSAPLLPRAARRSPMHAMLAKLRSKARHGLCAVNR
jgi:dynein heavy chain